jgi:hypothetical protein
MVTGLLDGVVLYAVSPDQEAKKLGRYMPRCWAEDTAYYGGMMYVKGLWDYMEIVDVRNPAEPTRKEVTTGARLEVSGRFGDSIIAKPGDLSGIKVLNVQQQ